MADSEAQRAGSWRFRCPIRTQRQRIGTVNLEF
jgi:hypothetical protein